MKTAIIVPNILNATQTAELHCANNGYIAYRKKGETPDGVRYEFFEEGDNTQGEGIVTVSPAGAGGGDSQIGESLKHFQYR